MKKIIKTLFSFWTCLAALSLQAEVKLPHIFSDNMVIQRDKPIKVWGWADPNEQVEIHFLNQTKKVKADKDGNWNVSLNGVPFGGPYILEVKGKTNKISLNDILIGEVWLCSGQSNMAWTVKDVNDAEQEISTAIYPQIRSFNVVRDMKMKPKSDLDGKWEVCSPATVRNFSAVAYFFARKLNIELGVPVGIINSSWGGTDVETWTSPEAFGKLPEKFKNRYSKMEIADFDKFVDENEQNKKLFEEAMSNDRGIKEKWFDQVDLSTWQRIDVPQLWENELGDVDGIIWFQYHLELPENAQNEFAQLELGPIDDNDVVWINGVKVGETVGYNIDRKYDVPKNVLKGGSNVITVKVVDTGGGGGMYGEAENMYLKVADKAYSLAGNWWYKISVNNTEFNYMALSPNMFPSLLYNAMINPINQFAIKGTIWYQGENNASEAYNYRTLFPALINDWREKWGYEFPFYWVQLANYLAKTDTPVESGWAELREAQTMTLSLPQTGQAVITDIGEANDIHPRNKQDVGLRLALIALNKDYGKKDIIYSGPTFRSLIIQDNKAIVSFDNIGEGLVVKNKYGYIEGFTIAGADKKFEWAKAYLDGDRVVVYTDKISNPVAVRYSWANNPDVNLYNKNGLPAAPFRTDDWKGLTQKD